MKLNTFPKVAILKAIFPVNTHVYFPVRRRTINNNKCHPDTRLKELELQGLG